MTKAGIIPFLLRITIERQMETTDKQLLQQTAEIEQAEAGKRLDQAVASLFPDYSRSRLTTWIKQGDLTLNGVKVRPRDKVVEGDVVALSVYIEPEFDHKPEPISLDILYEDDDILVLNKPINLVVHPAAGNREGTLLNGLLHHCADLVNVPRAGIVHRLDKDTSGILVVAKTLAAHTSLVAQLQERSFEREYTALVQGTLTGGGMIEEPIGRHPVHRKKMAVNPLGKEAITHFRLVERFVAHSLLKVNLETGRTHQIRVHLSHRHNAIVGDQLYAGRLKMPAGAPEEVKQALRNFKRQALHARKLGIVHPVSGESMCWEVDVPEDFQQLLTIIRDWKAIG